MLDNTATDIYTEFKQKIIDIRVVDVELVNNTNLQNANITEQLFKFSPSSLTPFAKAIYNSANTEERLTLLDGFNDDQIYIDKHSDKNDEIYNELLTNSKMGFYMEDYVCEKIRCPMCGDKLYKFAISNMPLIDMICTNALRHSTNKECYLWQVKTTVDNDTYFNKLENYITIPNNRYSDMIININTTSSNHHKEIQIGFICIHLQQHNVDEHKYTIIKNKSFVLIPNINLIGPTLTYYEIMLRLKNKLIIKWNQLSVIQNDLLTDDIHIDTNNVYKNSTMYINPLNKMPQLLFHSMI